MKFIDELKENRINYLMKLQNDTVNNRNKYIDYYKNKIIEASKVGFSDIILEFAGINWNYYDIVLNYFRTEGFTISDEVTKESLPFKNEPDFKSGFIKEVKISW